MEFKKQLVTPELAKKYLEANPKNRRVKSQVVTRYAQDIREGRWKEDTAEVIKISKTGIVLDGQHRLYAIIKANTSVWFHFAIGVPDEVFDVLDTGSVRNATDVFKISGVKNGNIIPSIIQVYWALNNNRSSSNSGSKYDRLTNAELLDKYLDNEDYWQFIARKSITWYQAFAKILPPSFIGGLFAHLYDIDKDASDRFMDQLLNGNNIENSTIPVLRQFLMKDRLSSKRINGSTKMAYALKTWNHYRKKTNTKFMRWLESEPFPTAV